MKAHVGRSAARGYVRVPGSKSYTIRAAICAAIAAGDSLLEGALESDDTAAVFECLGSLGARVVTEGGGVRISGGELAASREPLWCRESGATLRFLAAVCATVPGVTTLRCAPSLARRPMAPLVEALRQLGVECDFHAASGTMVIRGVLQQSGHVVVRSDVSSQFLSAMLLSGPRYADGLRIDLSSPIVSARYVEMTCECMNRFGVQVDATTAGSGYLVRGGYRPAPYTVEGDWSGAAALLALGALAGDVKVGVLSATSLQADVAMLDLLHRMGAHAESGDDVIDVHQSQLHGCSVNVSDAIDLLPVACVMAAAADGVTRLTGIARARDKESDRVASMADGLSRLGVRVEVRQDEMTIRGGDVRGGLVSSYGDHRVAMAFGVLGAVAGGVVVDGAECVSKTYPGFWDALSSLGVKVTFDEQ